MCGKGSVSVVLVLPTVKVVRAYFSLVGCKCCNWLVSFFIPSVYCATRVNKCKGFCFLTNKSPADGPLRLPVHCTVSSWAGSGQISMRARPRTLTSAPQHASSVPTSTATLGVPLGGRLSCSIREQEATI
ncbi:hypothetical protein LZ31DRAFT_82469 [Colletotrichum somersetense]|nr:hypothetical protein LZ31DRAFT_82469 [Colletotrichum somersetense]